MAGNRIDPKVKYVRENEGTVRTTVGENGRLFFHC